MAVEVVTFVEAERRARKKKSAEAAPPPTDWRRDAQKDDRGRLVPNLHNAVLGLSLQPDLKTAFAFDELSAGVMLMSPLPDAPGNWDKPRALTDGDVVRVQLVLQGRGLPKVGKETIADAIALRAREHSFNPFRDYLEALTWDGRPRVDHLMSDYFQAEPGVYAETLGRVLMLSIVARGVRPGCKVDQVIVLQGAQGARKSTACAILGGEWFSDALPDLGGSKDASAHLRGRILIELSELAGLGKADAAALKAFITRRSEKYRPAYGRLEIVEPRTCVFIGTSNQSVFLRDETGNRRFLPIEVGMVNTDALARDRDQLFAEAYSRFQAGEPWWPSPEFEREHAALRQEQAFEEDPWEEAIAAHLANLRQVRVKEIAVDALGFPAVARISTTDTRRIVAVLERLKWRRSKKKNWEGFRPFLHPNVIEKDDGDDDDQR